MFAHRSLSRGVSAAMVFCAAVFCLFTLLSAPALAAITVGGDAGEVSPANPSGWTSSTDGTIGQTDGKTGTLTVDGGSYLQSHFGYLAFNYSSSGTAVVTGTGSAWENSSFLYVGRNGIGTLMIEDSGRVSDTAGFLGGAYGSSGTAVVTGPDSFWNNSNYLNVGVYGIGTLRVENGGEVNSGYNGYLGFYSGAGGTALVTGEGSTWYSSRLCVGHAGTGR